MKNDSLKNKSLYEKVDTLNSFTKLRNYNRKTNQSAVNQALSMTLLSILFLAGLASLRQKLVKK